jgi:hypothetical protein
MDKAVHPLIPPAKKGLVRAPSGKELFRGREVGLMRRTSSIIRKERDTGVESQRMGLLGRKTSDGLKSRRNSAGGEFFWLSTCRY